MIPSMSPPGIDTVDDREPATDRHHRVLGALFIKLHAFGLGQGGRARLAGVPLWLSENRVRFPDIVYLSAARDHLRGEAGLRGADLVVEVLGPTPAARMLDLVTKRAEYAEAGIPEYWIVDPENAFITVLRLSPETATYVDAGLYERGNVARSHALAGLEVDVRQVVDAP